MNETGTSQVGTIPNAQKAQTFKNILRTFFQENTFENPKLPHWRAGCQLARAPGALKRGDRL